MILLQWALGISALDYVANRRFWEALDADALGRDVDLSAHEADNYVVTGAHLRMQYTARLGCAFALAGVGDAAALRNGVIVVNATVDVTDESCEEVYVSVLGQVRGRLSNLTLLGEIAIVDRA